MFTPTTSRNRIALLAPILAVISLFLVLSGSILETQAGDLAPNPTRAPTEEPIDDIVPNPTEEPTHEPIDDIVSNPTEVPTREPIDDVTTEPTREPVDDKAIPVTGTVRVIKHECPPGVPDNAFLSDYLFLCPDVHDGVEFVVNDVNSAQAGTTAGGMVEWTGVDPGVFNITETIPAGYEDPIVFCGYTESAGRGVQHPARQESAGGVVSGEFPPAQFEFVCYWMNVKASSEVIPGATDITSRADDGLATFLLVKRVCPSDILPGQGAAYYLDQCTDIVDGIPFTVSHANGSFTRSTSDGQAEWAGIPLGPFTVDEDVPVQFGEPIVFCGWTALYEGIVYDAFAQQVPAPGGMVELEVTIPGAHHFCFSFNVTVAGDLVDPSSVDNSLLLRKWICPDGTARDERNREYYIDRCELLREPVEFSLSTANGDQTKATADGFAEWTGLPLGAYTLRESIPAGTGATLFFCGWYALWDGYHYDAFPQLVVLAAAGVHEGEFLIPNTDAFCDVFNIEGDIDDFQANPTQVPAIDDYQGNATAGTVRLEKRSCPPGVPTDAVLSEYLTICTQLHDGVEFSLETTEGISTGTTAMGEVTWTGVPGGGFELQESIPPGYGDPIVFCGYTESPGGGVQHPSQQPAAGGSVEGAFPEDAIFEYVCYWMNVKTGTGVGSADDFVNAGGGGLSTLTIRNRGCPGPWADGMTLDVLDGTCLTDLDGATFEVTHANGSSTKPIVDTQASWQGLPLLPYTIDEAVPAGYGDPRVFCSTDAFGQDDAWLLSAHEVFQTATDGAIELQFDPPADVEAPDIARMQTTCTYYNFPLDPGSFTQPQETSNSLTVHAWVCPGDTEPVNDQAYLESRCSLSGDPVEMTLTTEEGASTQATDPDSTTWDNVPNGEFTLRETIPAGYGEPISFCWSTAFHNGVIYDNFPHYVPSPGGLVEGEIVVPNTSYACSLFTIATSVGIGGPDSVTSKPGDESNTLVAHAWFCPEQTTADAHLLDYFDHCQLASEPVEFVLTNGDGESTQATEGGTVQWEDVSLGPFTIRETVPQGFEILVVWCGWTAFHNGAVYDAFSQAVPVEDGVVEREISIPNTDFRCDFVNAPAVIDDVQANPTENAIDDVAANRAPGTLTISLAECAVDSNPWVDVYSQDVEYFSEWCDAPTTEFEFTVSSEDGYSETKTTSGFIVSFAGVPVASITIIATIPEDWSEPMALCWSDQADPTGWQVGNEVAWSVRSGEDIACAWINVIDRDHHVVTIASLACPEGGDPTGDYWTAIQECDEPLAGVGFTLVSEVGTVEGVSGGVTDAEGGAVWVDVDLGDSGSIHIREHVPEGYVEPVVWCMSYPEEDVHDPFEYEFSLYQAQDGAIVAEPERHEPFRFGCVFFNLPEDGAGQGHDEESARNGPAPAAIGRARWMAAGRPRGRRTATRGMTRTNQRQVVMAAPAGGLLNAVDRSSEHRTPECHPERFG